MEDHPLPGPFRPRFWWSPLRGRWLTSVLGAILLPGIVVVFLTGLASYAAYNPELPGNDFTPDAGLLRGYLFAWPTSPAWLYRLNQAVHVTVSLALVPVVLTKLWSVLPRFFAWPPFRSPAQALERLSLLGLVGGVVFTMATGILNIQYWYVFPAGFYTAHLYGAWVFMASFAIHVAVKLPTMRRSLRERRLRDELRTGLAATRPEPPDDAGLAAADPARPTISRRGLLATMSAGSLLLAVMALGQNVGGSLRRLALLAPRGQQVGDGPNDFQVNKTAASQGITADQTGSGWRLELDGPTPRQLSREDLLALPQHTAGLAIACVEGWSTGVQRWRGVRLADLAEMAGAAGAERVLVDSLQDGGPFASATLRGNQIRDPDSVLALEVNGVALSADHGFPARVVVPANPGVHNTKWVAQMTFEQA